MKSSSRIDGTRRIARACTFGLYASLLISAPAIAEGTLELEVSGAHDVFEGDPVTSSVDAHGRISMGLVADEIAELQGPSVVSLLAMPDGVLYAGTSGGGLHRIVSNAEKAERIGDFGSLFVGTLARIRGGVLLATNPDGALFIVDDKGVPKPFFDPKAKYIWSLLSDDERVLAATGEPGQVLEISRKGQSKVLFDPKETHLRAMVRHPSRGVVVGGGQKGVVYQLGERGAFALYDSSMEEVTAFAIDAKNGDLYAAFVSEKTPGAVLPGKSIGAVKGDEEASDTSPVKGSEIVRIALDGRVDLLWSSTSEGALALSFDETLGRLYFATGTASKGRARIYAIDSRDRDRLRLVARLDTPVISSLAKVPGASALVAGTAPAARLVRFGPSERMESTYVTSEQDLGRESEIGRIAYDADVPDGADVSIAIRSGNTKEYDDTWSPFSAPVRDAKGGAVSIPRGRYVQIRAELRASAKNGAPIVKALRASIARQNIAPSVDEVYLLRRGVQLAALPREEEGEKVATLAPNLIEELRASTKQPRDQVRVRVGNQPGMRTVSWSAKDSNQDTLLFRVEMRRLDVASEWSPLAEDQERTFLTFDTRAHPDGSYQFRVIATDRPSNPPDRALVDRNTSDPFTIDNTPPVIRKIEVLGNARGFRVVALAEDATSRIGDARFAVDGGPWLMLPAKDGLIDSAKESLEVDVTEGAELGAPAPKKGKRTILVRIEDEADNSATASATFERK